MKSILFAIAIVHVAVVNTRTGDVQRDANVIIDGDRIAAVGSGPPPPNSTIIDGRGKFLIPGLWDMHVHLSWTRISALPILVAHGVTGVRDLGSDLTELDGWRTRIEEGTLVGPRIVRVGPILNGKSFNKYQFVPGTADQTRAVARLLKWIGVDFLKVHRRMERESYFALIDEAKTLGIPVVGHIPMTVSPAEASDAGQWTVEHVATIYEGTFSAAAGGDPSPEAMRQWLSTDAPALFSRFVKNGTIFDPTLFAYFPQEKPADSPLAAKSMRERGAKRPLPTRDEVASARAVYEQFKATVTAANRAGVTIVTGTDIAEDRVPGLTMHQELAALVDCGLTPLQALQAATLNAASALKRSNESGTIEEGKDADLVLLDANPLDDIGNVTRIAAVISRGKLYDRKKLEELLESGKRLAGQN